MNKVLSKEFYQTENIISLSKNLLGKYLCTYMEGQLCSGKIVETEAYKAPEDKGSHAYGNRLTNRTSTMFLDGGISYVYLCYGIHSMFNVVSGPKGAAHAILIRALEPVDGVQYMKARRGENQNLINLTSGPGKLTKAMGILLNHDSSPLYDNSNGIWIENRGKQVSEEKIISGPRVGIAYAEECAMWPWRFRIKGNLHTSKPDLVSYG